MPDVGRAVTIVKSVVSSVQLITLPAMLIPVPAVNVACLVANPVVRADEVVKSLSFVKSDVLEGIEGVPVRSEYSPDVATVFSEDVSAFSPNAVLITLFCTGLVDVVESALSTVMADGMAGLSVKSV